jgi:hypothetical protein
MLWLQLAGLPGWVDDVQCRKCDEQQVLMMLVSKATGKQLYMMVDDIKSRKHGTAHTCC